MAQETVTRKNQGKMLTPPLLLPLFTIATEVTPNLHP
jgi:hypothetical protein